MSSSPVASRDAGGSDSQSDKQLEALRTRQAELEKVIAGLQSQRDQLVDASYRSLDSDQPSCDSETNAEVRAQAAVDVANTRIKVHIKQLQDYNDVKDVGTQLMGLIAEKRGVRIVEVQEEFGISVKD